MPRWTELSGAQKMWIVIFLLGFFSWATWESTSTINEMSMLRDIQIAQSKITTGLAQQQAAFTSISTELRATLSERGIRIASLGERINSIESSLHEVDKAMRILQIYVYPQHKRPPGYDSDK